MTIFRYVVCTALYICLFVAFAFARQKDLRFNHLTIHKGLTSNVVNSIMKDNKGFVWIATDNGISRYDGYTFVNYTSVLNDSTTISNNCVNYIFQDRENQIWACTNSGLDLYNRKLDKFDKHFLRWWIVKTVYADRKGQLWIAALKGLFLYQSDTKKLTKPFGNLFDFVSKDQPFNIVGSIYEDNYGNLWIGTTHGGLYQYNTKTQKLKLFKHDASDNTSISSDKIRQIIEDKWHRIWIATFGGGVNLFNHETQTFTRYTHIPDDPNSLSDNLVNSIFSAPDSTIWIGTDGNGINVFDTKRNLFHKYVHSENNPQSLNCNNIRTITGDDRGGIWIGTYSGGVNLFSENTEPFANYNIITKNGKNSVTAFAQDKNKNFWIGTDGGGLFYYNKISKSFTSVNYKRQVHEVYGNNKVISLLFDSKGYLWIGTYLDGLYRYDPLDNTCKRYTYDDKSGLSDNTIWYMLEDKQKRIWIATENGLNLYFRDVNKFTTINKSNSSLKNNEIRTLYEDSKNRLWIGTAYGLGFIFLNNTLSNNPIVTEIPCQRWIRSISEDTSKTIWIGTLSGEIYLYNEKHKKLISKFDDILPKSMISSILCDSKNVLWISTGNGLASVDINKNAGKKYYVSDGLQDNQFNINSFFRTQEEEFLFGGINGFNSFFPEEIKNTKKDENHIPIVITSFKIFNREILPGQPNSPLDSQICDTRQITLNYKQSVITLEFAALNYIHADKNSYSYRLKGLETEWNQIGNKHMVTYTNLKPGSYVFQVKASNKNDFSAKDCNLYIEVTPPFTGTLLFKFIIFIIILLALVFAFLNFKKKFREKIRVSQLIADLEMKALVAQMNPHFVFNCLNSIQEMIVANKNKNAMHYLSQFSQLLRAILHSSKKNTISLEQELNQIKIYLELESMRLSNKLNYSIKIAEDIESEDVNIPTFFIQPLIENAIWHGLMHKNDNRTLSLIFSLKGESALLCVISDNGIGRDRSAQIKRDNKFAFDSMSVKIITERIELLKKQGEIVGIEYIDEKDINGNSIGTTVKLILPIINHTILNNIENDNCKKKQPIRTII